LLTGPAEFVFARQTLWADRHGHRLSGSAPPRGRLAYTATLEENLFERLTSDARKEFTEGDGGELGRGGTVPGKMQAVHSSSALSCNLFHYWRRVGRPDIIAKACGLPVNKHKISLAFEQHLPIDPRFRFSPNLDALFTYEGGPVRQYGVECKFSEPFSTRMHLGMKEKYFGKSLDDLWTKLPNVCALGKKLCPDNTQYTFLDAAQLVKHVLGLRRCSGMACGLLYLYYDVPGPEGVKHAAEIAEFAAVAQGDGVRFTFATYQDVLLRLAAEHRHEHAAYIDYMVERYL
jgi:hypothetical protein